MTKISGHCLCGEVTYSADGDPIAQAICHCTNCQRQTGTAFSVVIGVRSAGFHVAGATLAAFPTVGEIHGTETLRHFCSACGSPIYSSVEALPDVVFVKAGTLDDASWLEPNAEVWTRSAQPWSPHLDGSAKFERMPGA